MIEVQHSQVNEEQFPYQPLSSPTSEGLESYERIQYSASSLERDEFHALLSALFHKTLETHQLFFVYIESKPQAKRAVRSHKKMLYEAIQSGQLSKADVYEEELDVSNGQSLLSAAIRGTSDNIGYIQAHQLHSNFRFALVLPKKAFFSPSDLLLDIPNLLLPTSKLSRVDVPKLLRQYAPQSLHFFLLPFDANERLRLTLFVHQYGDAFKRVMSVIEQTYTVPQRN